MPGTIVITVGDICKSCHPYWNLYSRIGVRWANEQTSGIIMILDCIESIKSSLCLFLISSVFLPMCCNHKASAWLLQSCSSQLDSEIHRSQDLTQTSRRFYQSLGELSPKNYSTSMASDLFFKFLYLGQIHLYSGQSFAPSSSQRH